MTELMNMINNETMRIQRTGARPSFAILPMYPLSSHLLSKTTFAFVCRTQNIRDALPQTSYVGYFPLLAIHPQMQFSARSNNNQNNLPNPCNDKLLKEGHLIKTEGALLTCSQGTRQHVDDFYQRQAVLPCTLMCPLATTVPWCPLVLKLYKPPSCL